MQLRASEQLIYPGEMGHLDTQVGAALVDTLLDSKSYKLYSFLITIEN